MANVESRELGAAVFAEAAINALRDTGLTIGQVSSEDSISPAEDDVVVILNVGGSWHGAVAMRINSRACEALAESLFGRPPKSDEERAEAMMEAANVATGRGVAALGSASPAAVWLTPPLCVKGLRVSTRLHNTKTSCHSFALGEGQVTIVFAAAEKEI